MAYVRKKRIGERQYYQLVVGRRVNGRVRQRVIVHLGKYPTVDEAVKAWRSELNRTRAAAHQYESEANVLESKVVALESEADMLDNHLSRLSSALLKITKIEPCSFWRDLWKQYHTKVLTEEIRKTEYLRDRQGGLQGTFYRQAKYEASVTIRHQIKTHYEVSDLLERYHRVMAAHHILYERYRKRAQKLTKQAEKLQAKLDRLEGLSL